MGQRLIDAEALQQKIKEYGNAAIDAGNLSIDTVDSTVEILRILDAAPTVDAVPVVRCRECKHSEKIDYQGRWLYCCMRYAGPSVVRKDDFCSHGERKEG